MGKKTLYVVQYLSEVCIGLIIGICVRKFVHPRCDETKKKIVNAGSTFMSFILGRNCYKVLFNVWKTFGWL